MNRFQISISAAIWTARRNLALATIIASGWVASGGICSATFFETFENGTVGSPPAGWTLSGTNGTTATANISSQAGNQFVAFRDLSGVTDINLTRPDPNGGITNGVLEFDVRFNAGVSIGLNVKLLTAGGLEPITLSWFHGANNTNNPMVFRARGNGSGFGPVDPNAFAAVTGNFPTGSWQTVRVEFTDNPNPLDNLRGNYKVIWGGITNSYYYLNQSLLPSGDVGALNRLEFTSSGGVVNFDLDNVAFFIPEPGTAMLFGVGGMVMWLRRGRRKIADCRLLICGSDKIPVDNWES